MITQNKFWLGLLLFFGFSGLYIHTQAPQLVPYRDAGEMATLLKTLSVAHPPGYPLYTFFGKLFTLIPLGNDVYRTCLFSALAGSACLVVLFYLLCVWVDSVSAFFTCGLFGFTNPFWELSNVTEMYSLGFLFLGLLLLACFYWRSPLLIAFVLGLSLGVRMDLLLLVPIFLVWLYFKEKYRHWMLLMIFFALGLTVFLYLPIRSLQDPVIDWGNPESLKALFNSISRKSYAGTLDLLSLNYKKGENFLVGLMLYGGHLTKSFGMWIWIVLLTGVVVLYQKNRSIFYFSCGGFFVTGILYLFLANMPPNPHAIAVLEATFPVPDIFILVPIAFGLMAIRSLRFGPGVVWVVLSPLLFINALNGHEAASKRDLHYARDYTENILRSAPRSSVVVMHEDVQLFSLWEEQVLRGRRPDLSLISRGLSASPWYWDMRTRWDTAPAPFIGVKTAEGWRKMREKLGRRFLLAGQETDVEYEKGIKLEPYGLLNIVTRKEDEKKYPFLEMDTLYLYRGRYIYGKTPDFFSSDLISDYARAYHRVGMKLLKERDYKRADTFFQRAEVLEPDFSPPSLNRGYLRYLSNNHKEAVVFYKRALRKQERDLKRTEEYKSLPRLVKNVKKDMGNTLVYLGATTERMKDVESSRTYYEKAIAIYPHAQAYYNLAVTYWNKDWDRVVLNMRRALEYNPRMAEAQRYLQQALAQQKKQN